MDANEIKNFGILVFDCDGDFCSADWYDKEEEAKEDFKETTDNLESEGFCLFVRVKKTAEMPDIAEAMVTDFEDC